ncbi:hypothetical protein SSX86_030065 [Deinandra increscens subsp. villosa]|uniref:Uncharacterized protein n=1 Tax=Deinandra increscens subsp. villosa TaxID=3103831 RepID=A0AAP0GL64_9ASTR
MKVNNESARDGKISDVEQFESTLEEDGEHNENNEAEDASGDKEDRGEENEKDSGENNNSDDEEDGEEGIDDDNEEGGTDKDDGVPSFEENKDTTSDEDTEKQKEAYKIEPRSKRRHDINALKEGTGQGTRKRKKFDTKDATMDMQLVENEPGNKPRRSSRKVVSYDPEIESIEDSPEDKKPKKGRKARSRTGGRKGGAKGKNGEEIEVKDDDGWFSSRTRSAPHQLFKAVTKLKENQRAALGHFVVDKFNPKTLEIDLGTAKIKVDHERISQLFGLQNQGFDLEPTAKKKLHPIGKEWKARYPSGYITRVQAVEKIDSSEEAGTMFKLDFISVFISVMAEAGVSEYMKLDYLPNIKNDTNLDGINWNNYIIGALKRCKENWVRCVSNIRFTGPLLVLTLAYVDSMACEGINVERNMSPLKFWTGDMLKIREKYEIANGGFGIGTERCTYVDNEGDDSDVNSDGDGKTKKEKKDKGKKDHPENMSLQEQTEKLSLFFNTSEKQKKEIEKALSEAWAKFPGNKEVKAYIEQYRSHYKEVVDIEIQEERGDVQNTTGNAEKNTEGVESGQSEKEKDVGLKFVRRVQKKTKKGGKAPEEEHVEKDPKEGEQEIDALINKIAGGKKKVEKVVDKTSPSFDFGSPFDSGLESSQSSQELIKEGKETSLNIKEKITALYKQSVGNTIQEEHENATEADKDGVGKENTEMGASEKKTEKFKSNAGKSVAKGELGVERSEWKPVDINRGMGQRERVAWQYLMSFAETQEKLTEGNEKNSKIETDSKKSENDEDELEKKRIIEEEKAEVAASFAKDVFAIKAGAATLVETKAFLLASLRPEKDVFANVVNCWAAVLNFEERTSTDNKPKRLFCHATTIDMEAKNKEIKQAFGRNTKDVLKDIEFIKRLDKEYYTLEKELLAVRNAMESKENEAAGGAKAAAETVDKDSLDERLRLRTGRGIDGRGTEDGPSRRTGGCSAEATVAPGLLVETPAAAAAAAAAAARTLSQLRESWLT